MDGSTFQVQSNLFLFACELKPMELGKNLEPALNSLTLVLLQLGQSELFLNYSDVNKSRIWPQVFLKYIFFWKKIHMDIYLVGIN